MRFEPGDELLTTNHEYNACRNALEMVAHRWGARVVVANVPFPVNSEDEVLDALLSRLTARTKLLLVDHATSLTGIVTPVRKIVAAAAERGVDTLVDGAHAPGMLPLDIAGIGAAYYTGNCHKWLCAAKGSAILYVRRDRQSRIRPLTISHGANAPLDKRSRFRMEFDWTGTRDPTPYLCAPEAVRFMGSLLPGGWPELMARNRALTVEARRLPCESLDVPPACPDSMLGTLASIPMASGTYDFTTTALEFDPVEDVLREEYGTEVPVLSCPDGPGSILRIACQIYNTIEEYRYPAPALDEIRSRGA